MATTTTTTILSSQLESLLAPSSTVTYQTAARDFLTSSIPSSSSSSSSSSSTPQGLGIILSTLLENERIKQSKLNRKVDESEQIKRELLTITRRETEHFKLRVRNLKNLNTSLKVETREIKSQLVSDLGDQVKDDDEDEDTSTLKLTLKERLNLLCVKRKRLLICKQWFEIIVKAEILRDKVLQSLSNNLPKSFKHYVDLVDYIKLVYSQTHDESLLLEGGNGNNNGMVGLTGHLNGIGLSIWNHLVKVLSTRLLNTLESLGWPTPFPEPLDPFQDEKVAQFQTAFVDLLTLELLQNNNVLPGNTTTTSLNNNKPKPLLALIPLVHPLLLRFKWQFSTPGRSTNRIDKPEYPLSFILNLLTSHERFLTEDVQYLLTTNGFDHLDALNEFTSLLLTPLQTRLKRDLPLLIQLPQQEGLSILAHTVYQVIEFDQVLRSRGFQQRKTIGTSEQEFIIINQQQQGQVEVEWEGLIQVILGRSEWFDKWFKGEKDFFETRYYSAITSPTAWEIIPRQDYYNNNDSLDAAVEQVSLTRPTESALRIKELIERLTLRFKPLPLKHTLPFLLDLLLPILTSYSQRINSGLDSFENLSFFVGVGGGILTLPGNLTQLSSTSSSGGGHNNNNSETSGVRGLTKLIKAGISARWMGEKCEEWGEDAFFLNLYEYLESIYHQREENQIDLYDYEPSELMQELMEEVLENSDGTLFDREIKNFKDLEEKSLDFIVRHVTREVLNDLKPYLTKDFKQRGQVEEESTTTTTTREEEEEEEEAEAEEFSLSRELISPLTLLSNFYREIFESFPTTVSTSLYRRISQSLSRLLFDRLLISRNEWNLETIKQFEFDLRKGFFKVLPSGEEATTTTTTMTTTIKIERGWEVVLSGIKLLSLETQRQNQENNYDPKSRWIFSKVIQVVWEHQDNDDEGGESEYSKMFEDLGIGERVLSLIEVKTLLRKRPECWR